MKKLFAICLAAGLLGGCYFRSADTGFSLLGHTSNAGQVTDNVGVIRRQGKACSTNILHLFAFGDSSIATAKRNGGITKVYSVDYELNTFVVGANVCTLVSGE